MTKYHKKEDGNEIRKALGMYLRIYLPMFHSTVTILIYVIYKFALSLIKYQRHLKTILSMQRIYYYIRD